MENASQGPSKGYQKQIKKEEPAPKSPSKPKGNYGPAYTSPTAKKWPFLVEALNDGNADAVKQLIEEGVNVNLLRDGVTPLMTAASKGHAAVAEVLLQAGVNINERSDDGSTALHMAASDQAGTAVVELLLHSGIDSGAQNKLRKTALALAEEKKHQDIADVIKRHQQQLLSDDREWRDFLKTPEGRPYEQKERFESLSSLMKFLWLPPLVLGGTGFLLGLLPGAPVIAAFAGVAGGVLAGLFLTSWRKKIRSYLDTVEPLPAMDIHILREKRKAGEPLTVDTKSPETAAPEETPDETIIEVTSSNIFPDDQAEPAPEKGGEEEPLVRKKKITVTPALVISAAAFLTVAALIGAVVLYRGPLVHWYYAKRLGLRDIQVTGQAFLGEVAQNNEEAVDLFIKAGIDTAAANDKGRNALHIASEKGYINIITKLVSLNPALLRQPDKNGSTALVVAAREGQEAAVKALITGGADVNYLVPSSSGAVTPLQAAVEAPDFRKEHVRIVQYLLQKGADPKRKSASGQSPLLSAADSGHADVAALLIEKGAAVDDTDGKGYFPLMAAACQGHAGLVALLVEKGANVNLTSSDGRTPLMCAAQSGNPEIFKTLLDKGAGVNAKASDGTTALSDATRAGNAAFASLLLARGAEPRGYLPGEFTDLKGRTISLAAKGEKLSDVLRRIGMTAAQDGYVINFDYTLARKITMKTKAPWNRTLRELAGKNHLLLVVKEKEVSVLPYAAASSKRKTN